jgi:hypothetical protein
VNNERICSREKKNASGNKGRGGICEYAVSGMRIVAEHCNLSEFCVQKYVNSFSKQIKTAKSHGIQNCALSGVTTLCNVK